MSETVQLIESHDIWKHPPILRLQGFRCEVAGKDADSQGGEAIKYHCRHQPRVNRGKHLTRLITCINRY